MFSLSRSQCSHRGLLYFSIYNTRTHLHPPDRCDSDKCTWISLAYRARNVIISRISRYNSRISGYNSRIWIYNSHFSTQYAAAASYSIMHYAICIDFSQIISKTLLNCKWNCNVRSAKNEEYLRNSNLENPFNIHKDFLADMIYKILLLFLLLLLPL